MDAQGYFSDDASIISVGGSYDIAPKIGLLGSVFLADFDFGDRITGLTVGAEYELGPHTDAFATVGYFSSDFNDATSITAGVSYDLGKRRGGFQSPLTVEQSLLNTAGGIALSF